MGQYSPLFRKATQAARAEARRMFSENPIGQLLQSAWRRPRPQEVLRVLSALQIHGPTPQALRGLMGMRFAGISWTIERYAKREDDLGQLVRAWMESLGPPGKLLLGLFGSSSIWMESNRYAWLLQGAIRFLQAYGYEVLPAPSTVKPSSPLYERAKAAAWEWLRQAEGVLPPSGTPTEAPTELFQDFLQPPPPTGPAVVDMGPPAGLQRLPPEHPALTGEFQSVDSANVHSIAYDYQEGTLFVRFWEKRWDREAKDFVKAGPGPIYAYFFVPPQMFLDLLEAPSKGGWLWDNIRIRGTISGHQFDYRLVAVSRGYVPRKATFMPLQPGQWNDQYAEVFMPRFVQLPGGQWRQSVRPLEVVRTFSPTGPIPPEKVKLFGIG